MRPVTIDLLQIVASTSYAALLQAHAHRLTSDDTWKQVAAGDALCMGFAALRFGQRPDLTAERATLDLIRSFVAGGLPIIAWQIGRSLNHHANADAALQEAFGEVLRDEQISAE